MAHRHPVKRQKIGEHTKQAKKSQTNKVGHRSKWWLIETTNNEEGETTNNEEGGTTNNEEGGKTNNEEGGTTNNEEGREYGEDYQVPPAPCGKERLQKKTVLSGKNSRVGRPPSPSMGTPMSQKK